MYTSHDGSEIYRGEFELGKRNGCAAARHCLYRCLLSRHVDSIKI